LNFLQLRVGVRIGFDEALAHKIEAGADIFLMPLAMSRAA
jgi:glycogen synthase